MHNAELIGRVAQASADVRNMGQVWCDTENPAAESRSLNASRLQLERRRRQGKAPQTGDSNTRPSMPSRAGSGCKAMAMSRISANKPQDADNAPQQDSPAGSSSEHTSSENRSSSEHRSSNTWSRNTSSEPNLSEQ